MRKESKAVKWLLIGISFFFIFVMLVLPLITVITEDMLPNEEERAILEEAM